jgi:aminoglycoside phosphotransferase (APT) family kinase protein
MGDGEHYDSIDFPDYLDGTASGSVALWTDTPRHLLPLTDTSIKATREKHSPTTEGLVLQRYDALTRKYLGSPAIAAEFPGGKGRDTWRLLLSGHQSVIVTRRESPTRAVLEARVLELLHDNGAPVPKLLAFNGLILFQEDVGRLRLSNELARVKSADEYGGIISGLIDSLFDIYRAADRADLHKHTPMIGRVDSWTTAMIDRTALIGHRLAIPSPRPNVERMQALFRVYDPEFVKWDARPGNVMRRPDGRPCWIDWEHCGARHRLDDLVWLLADEATPFYPDTEMKIIESALPRYETSALGRLSHEYLFTFGVCHMAVRLARILANKSDDAWDAVDQVNPTDEERVSLQDALTLCRRAELWCGQAPAVRNLRPWFNEIANALQAL